MNWIKQNQMLAGIAAVAIVGSLALLWLAFSNMAAATKSTTSYKNASGEMARLYGESVYPTQDNLSKRKKQVEELKAEADTLRAGLAKNYGAPEGGDAATFGQRVQSNFNDVKSALEAAKITFPDTFFLGFDTYRLTVAANPAAVRELDYQLNAITALMKSAADAGITGIDRFARSPVSGEAGGPSDKNAADPMRRYSMEIHLTGSESSIRAFINSIAAGNRYFYAFRAIRLMNEVQTGPKKDDVRKQVKAPAPAPAAGGAAADIFAAFAADTPPPAAPAPEGGGDGGPIIDGGEAPLVPAPAPAAFSFGKPRDPDAFQFLGAEKVKAAVRLDLVIFQPMPVVKSGDEETN